MSHKKIVIILPLDVDFDISGVVAKATFLSIETIIAPPSTVESDAAKRGSRIKEGWTRDQAIMEHFTADGYFIRSNGEKWLQARGFAAAGFSSAISRLSKSGHIRALGSGRFQFLKPMIIPTVQSPLNSL